MEKRHVTQAHPGKRPFVSFSLFSILTLVVGLYIVNSNATLSHLLDLKDRKETLQSESNYLIQDIHDLKREITALKSDPDLNEKLIRERFGYAKADEKVIWLKKKEEAGNPGKTWSEE